MLVILVNAKTSDLEPESGSQNTYYENHSQVLYGITDGHVVQNRSGFSMF